MKLFYSKGSCALAPHIVMAEMNMVYELEAVDLKTKACASGDFRKINAKGSVPVLRMENGEFLSEGAVICQYLADQKIDSGLLPKFGTTDRYRCMEWMNYISTEVHKSFSPLFSGVDEVKKYSTEVLTRKMNYLSETMGTNEYLMGKNFSIADAYLFTCLGWTQYVKMDLNQWPNLKTYVDRVAARPAVIKAMKEQGML